MRYLNNNSFPAKIKNGENILDEKLQFSHTCGFAYRPQILSILRVSQTFRPDSDNTDRSEIIKSIVLTIWGQNNLEPFLGRFFARLYIYIERVKNAFVAFLIWPETHFWLFFIAMGDYFHNSNHMLLLYL